MVDVIRIKQNPEDRHKPVNTSQSFFCLVYHFLIIQNLF